MRWPGSGVLISYDIGADRTRRTIDRSLRADGWKAFYSAFALPPFDPAELTDLLDGIARLTATDDHVMALPWCSACRAVLVGVAHEPAAPRWVTA